MRVVRFSVEITVIMTVFFCQSNQKHVMHTSEVTNNFCSVLVPVAHCGHLHIHACTPKTWLNEIILTCESTPCVVVQIPH
jgi:hypothetical protein